MLLIEPRFKVLADLLFLLDLLSLFARSCGGEEDLGNAAETIMASLLGLFMFGETMTTFQIIGGALIVCGGVAQIFFSTAAASKQGEKIEKEEEIRENLEARLDQEQEREALS